MRWLLFLSRLAFICGFFFLVSFSLLLWDWSNEQAVIGTIIIIGHVIGLVTIPTVNLCYAVLLVKRKLSVYVPLWLAVANLLFLLILILYILYNFYLNDPYYH